MRRSIAVVVAVSLAVACGAPALAAGGTVDLPAKFSRLIPGVKKKSGVAVRLPSTLHSYVKRTYAEGSASHGRYDLELGAAKGCGGATACFIASFSGVRGGTPAFKRKVSLARGITGYFKPVTCGASCSPAFVQWRQGGVLYEIEFKGALQSKEKSTMIALANSAIRGGAR
ncbi:MAG: hypothetical protein QOC95_989 [Thermoleophilaceae bacterium]|jgi:hypothetical protein|nr:hypothetical protein [Thermoleophilaceae bacterium]